MLCFYSFPLTHPDQYISDFWHESSGVFAAALSRPKSLYLTTQNHIELPGIAQ